ncbi:hypothetical protein [Chelatococcus sambhunathii]|uniref:hypothetical protein n=1 Tax=Chelatococcus sambhunathii TaxID=363953 RepID=UPI0028524F5C|nr:hypothetical protein [Chelatococcus sambhunathii]
MRPNFLELGWRTAIGAPVEAAPVIAARTAEAAAPVEAVATTHVRGDALELVEADVLSAITSVGTSITAARTSVRDMRAQLEAVRGQTDTLAGAAREAAEATTGLADKTGALSLPPPRSRRRWRKRRTSWTTPANAASRPGP